MVLIIGLPDYALYFRDVCMVSSLRKDKYVRTVTDEYTLLQETAAIDEPRKIEETTIGHIRLMHETHVD